MHLTPNAVALRYGDRIKCQGCETPAAVLWDGELYIEHRHHGEVHLTILSIAELAMLMQRRERAGA